MDHIIFGCEWKATSDPGTLEGYMSVFNVVDQGSDVVRPGAFKKTFSDWSRAKAPMPLVADHQLSTDGVIGSVTAMLEDGKGAKVKARFSGVAKAQEVRQKMLEGHLSGMSFTYQPIKYSFGQIDGKEVRYLEEVKVFEATVTPFPMNVEALASAKDNLSGAVDVAVKQVAFETSLRALLELPDESLRSSVLNQVISYYSTTPAAGPVDEPATASEAVSPDDSAADTTPPVSASAYAVALISPSEPRADALDPPANYGDELLDVARTQAEMERLEAEINDALGGNQP